MPDISSSSSDPSSQHASHWRAGVFAGALLTILAVGFVAIVGVFVQHRFFTPPVLLAQPQPSDNPATAPEPPSQAKSAAALLSQLAADVDTCMAASRPILLGSRDPKGPSCVSVIRPGDVVNTVPNNPGDLDGGPGTQLATLYYFARRNCGSPTEDFNWHQNRLKTFLQNKATVNKEALALSHDLTTKAMELSREIETWTDWPAGFSAIYFTNKCDWPRYCLASLDEAIAARSLVATKRWAAEFAAAAFALEDLHRWLDFLTENQLDALAFQTQCQSLFSAADAVCNKYDPTSTFSQFPAGELCLHGVGNYYEVEHQAERLFVVPAERINEITTNKHLTPASLWVLPGLRECYLKLEEVLSPENKNTLALAARSPYEHSYLANMLFRAWRGDMAEQLCNALRRFNTINPQASVPDLMGTLMYRGHSFGGLEWADRYQPELIDAANQVAGSDSESLMTACNWTFSFYHGPAKYGSTLTLRDAIEHKKLDCVRATDMIGAIYRNAGRTRFGHVRWCAESVGHSVAAIITSDNGQWKALVADGMMPPPQPEPWPDTYFHGHAWPHDLAGNPTPYAVELYVRGIDNYVWAEGYIVRGPNAGTLAKTTIPYLPYYPKNVTQKVYDGPYPH